MKIPSQIPFLNDQIPVGTQGGALSAGIDDGGIDHPGDQPPPSAL